MERIYMDYAATTYVDPEVKKEIDSYFTERFGNPGSFNYFGLEAKNGRPLNQRTRVTTAV